MRIRYVEVSGRTDAVGNVVPERITWEEGRTWEIRRVLHTARAPAGEYRGIRYTVLIDDEEKYIYRDGDRWYVLTEA